MTEQTRQMVERRMVLSYAPPHGRASFAALLALDDTLGNVVRSTRDPMIGQMRLTWWHSALTRLDTAPPPAQPLLRALADTVVPRVTGAELAEMIEGWEELLEPEPLDEASLDRFACARGTRLFEAAGRVLGVRSDDPLAVAGRGWALADLAAHVRDPAAQGRAAAMAGEALDAATARRWSRPARALGAMAHLSRMDAGAPRVARALWHRLTGR